jgi:hypothetical protein
MATMKDITKVIIAVSKTGTVKALERAKLVHPETMIGKP